MTLLVIRLGYLYHYHKIDAIGMYAKAGYFWIYDGGRR